MPWHVLPAVLFYDRSHGISNILFFFFSFARFDSPSRRERGYETVVFFLFVPLRSSSFVLLPRLLVRLRQVEWRFIREGGGEREQKNSSVRESAVETSFNVQSVEKERGLVDRSNNFYKRNFLRYINSFSSFQISRGQRANFIFNQNQNVVKDPIKVEKLILWKLMDSGSI